MIPFGIHDCSFVSINNPLRSARLVHYVTFSCGEKRSNNFFFLNEIIGENCLLPSDVPTANISLDLLRWSMLC